MPLCEFRIILNAHQAEAFEFLADLSHIHLWDPTLDVVVAGPGTAGFHTAGEDKVVVRDCSGFWHDLGILGGAGGMQMVYSMTGWSPPDFVVFGGVPAAGSAPIARRIHLRFAPGPTFGTTELHYSAEIGLQGLLEPASWASSGLARQALEQTQKGIETAFRRRKQQKLLASPGSNEEQRATLKELEKMAAEAAADHDEIRELAQAQRRISDEHRKYVPALASEGATDFGPIVSSSMYSGAGM